MAYNYVWPATLPQVPQKGFTETGGANIVSTPMDQGIAKRRYRGKKPQTMQLSFIMTDAQVQTLETFVLGPNFIRSISRFGFTHPRTHQTVEVRLIPQGEGAMYNLSYLAPGYWTVSLQMEILP
jgi:hypothetical protein